VAQLLGVRIQNYKTLADVSIGRLGANTAESDLSPVSCFIGKNGCGKSSLLDVFAFVSDCLREGVESACDKEQRGGFERLRTQGRTGPIKLTLHFKLNPQDRPIWYSLSIDERKGVPAVIAEHLKQATKGARRGQLKSFLDVTNGEGKVWAGDTLDGARRFAPVRLADHDKLAIATFGQLADHPRISGFRAYLESWYLSYFVPGDARRIPTTGAQRRLDRTGSNLGNVLQYMERQDPTALARTLREIAEAIPGLTKIATKKGEDNRLLLAFNEQGYRDPFFQYSMSDGTLKMFAYLLLLHDPDPPAFVGIEEPENGLYHQLHGQLSSKMLELTQSQGRTQLLVTTHSPYFVDTLQPDAVWTMQKKVDGTTMVRRASLVSGVREALEAGAPLGSLWYSNHLDLEA
jgi:predicted ATPase